ncbi:MAG TPA: hypothetical protein VHI13_02745 [Candidatus Kapabacteria bacterium]|nr:hypothetical protein [Candidatus Kapabacteria bacterium]
MQFFQSWAVAATYQHARPADTTPTPQELADWDAHLNKIYTPLLPAALAGHGIRDTPWNRAIAVLLAESALGLDFPTKLSNALLFFQRGAGAFTGPA